MCYSFPCAAAGLAAEVVAAAGDADELTFRDDEFAAGVDVSRVAADFEAFEHGVVDTHVMGGGGDDVVSIRIPQDNVRIAAGSEDSLFGVHAEDARGSGGDE